MFYPGMNEKHKSFVCDVCAQSRERLRTAGCAKRTAHSPLCFRRREITSTGKSVSCICVPRNWRHEESIPPPPVSQRAVNRIRQRRRGSTCRARIIRCATTNPFADSVEINPTVFAELFTSRSRPIEPPPNCRCRATAANRYAYPVKFVHALLFAKRRMRCDVRVW